MKPGTITHTVAALLSSAASIFTANAASTPAPKGKVKISKTSNRLHEDVLLKVDPITFDPATTALARPRHGDDFPWKNNIVTTVFWIGEQAGGNNPVPNDSSSWDGHWGRSYGGFDDPNPSHRDGYIPARFTPRQNPFYCALPYNDKARTRSSAGSAARRSVVQAGVSGAGRFRLQRALGRHPQRQPCRLRAMGGRRAVSDRQLAVCFR